MKRIKLTRASVRLVGILWFMVIQLTGCLGASKQSLVPQLIGQVDKVLVYKSERKLILLKKDRVIKEYRVALGKDPVGTKYREGDNKTPEGIYRIDYKNPNSFFYKSLKISYPNKEDRLYALRKGWAPGGNIVIHGLHPNIEDLEDKHWLYNWTKGCIAVTNKEIEEIFEVVPVGTTIEIYA